jgi:hypothetical protein
VLNGILSVGVCTLGGEAFYGKCHLYTHQKVEPAALKINGFVKDDIVWKANHEKDSAHEMVRRLVEWAENLPSAHRPDPLGYFVGQNVRWDYEMVRCPWENVFRDGPSSRAFPFSHRTLDLHSLTCAAFLKEGRAIPATGIGSKETQEYLKLPDEPKPHNALTSAEYHRDMFVKLIAKL